ncbi:FTR1 family iron permease [Alkalinema pantanalense CENA528]|uniref:FTR1 family iron permease n=1 Tax=Alkalinema pantanalense TaxID=1620705 RepID=UPI003D6E1930
MEYTWLDSFSILLREGMEALLVLIALLAFLDKSGNQHRRIWIWLGAIAGLAMSVIAGFGIQAVVSNVSALRSNKELLEGVTGLIAAAMLFYVSYWLHSKSALNAWQGYIHEQMTAALETQRVFSLAVLSFLTVFREGGETVLFFLGIAPSISSFDLLLGIGAATGLLAIVTMLMLTLGLKIPLKPFFQITSALIYYLGFKFLGSSVHALQAANLFPLHPIVQLPKIRLLGFYPTWETMAVQAALLLVAVGIFLKTWLPKAPWVKSAQAIE